MPLMDRIKILHFLQQSPESRLALVIATQEKRLHSLQQSRLKPVRKASKKATKRKTKDPVDVLAKLLKKNPHLVESIKASYGIK